jgi:hypothetical protein
MGAILEGSAWYGAYDSRGTQRSLQTLRAKGSENMIKLTAPSHAKAEHLLEHARDLISGDRNRTHGDRHENFARTAAIINAVFDSEVTAADVPLLMVCLKLGRLCVGAHNLDNYTDGAGYMALAGELADKAEREKTPEERAREAAILRAYDEFYGEEAGNDAR